MAVERGPIAARRSLVHCDGLLDRSSTTPDGSVRGSHLTGWDAVRAPRSGGWVVGGAGVDTADVRTLVI